MTIHEEIKTAIPAMDGWCSPETGCELADLVLKAKSRVVCEVGVFGGRSLVSMALALKQQGFGKIIGIDPWDAKISAAAQSNPTDEKWWGELDHEKVYQTFLWHLRRRGVEQFVEIQRTTSDNASVPPEICILNLDGDHCAQAVKDARKFAPHVRLGGYCILDDLDWSGGFVRQAEEFIKSIGFVFLRKIGDQGGLYQRAEIIDPAKIVTANAESRPLPLPQLTVAFVTGRNEPCFEWFFDSLRNQMLPDDRVNIIVVDFHAERRNKEAYDTSGFASVKWVEPKPTIWQGKYKIAKNDFWAMSNARNTAFCLCQTEWIAFCDDRCVLMPGWLEAVRRAMAGHYIVCGSYEKRSRVIVENGFIKGYDQLIGKDSRFEHSPNGLKDCPGGWMFGCTFALPLEWALRVNGFNELLDSLSMEDVIFGLNLANSGFSLRYDPQMKIVEDRTEGELSSGHGVDGVLKRTDKGKSPNDKSHAALARFGTKKTAEHFWNLLDVKIAIDRGEAFPIPDPNKNWTDWYDGQKVSEFE